MKNTLRIILLMLLLLAGCAPIAPISTPAPEPAHEILLATPGITINMHYEAEELIVDIYSETGIGEATISVPTIPASMPIALRLHLRALEGWKFTFDNLSTSGAADETGNIYAESQVGEEALQVIDESSPMWMQATHVPNESDTNGYYELTLPRAFLESGLNEFTISFVDYYR